MSNNNIYINNKMSQKQTILEEITQLNGQLEALTIKKNKMVELQGIADSYLSKYTVFFTFSTTALYRSSNNVLARIDDEQATTHKEKITEIRNAIEVELQSINTQSDTISTTIYSNNKMANNLNEEIIELRKEGVEKC